MGEGGSEETTTMLVGFLRRPVLNDAAEFFFASRQTTTQHFRVELKKIGAARNGRNKNSPNANLLRYEDSRALLVRRGNYPRP